MDVYSNRNLLSRPIIVKQGSLPPLLIRRRGYKTYKKHQEGFSEFIRQRFKLSISFKILLLIFLKSSKILQKSLTRHSGFWSGSMSVKTVRQPIRD